MVFLIIFRIENSLRDWKLKGVPHGLPRTPVLSLCIISPEHWIIHVTHTTGICRNGLRLPKPASPPFHLSTLPSFFSTLVPSFLDLSLALSSMITSSRAGRWYAMPRNERRLTASTWSSVLVFQPQVNFFWE